MDPDVLTFVEGVRNELLPLNARILDHPYLQALQTGRIARERLRIFAVQQSYIIGSDLRSVALMVARASSDRNRAFFLELLDGERAALKALDSFTAAVAGDAPISRLDEPLAGAFAYCAFVAWLSLNASEAEFVGALLINLPIWGANCRRMAEALQRQYRLAETDVAFFSLFATAPPGFEDRAASILADGLTQGVPPDKVRRAAALLQGYELLFWDTLAQSSMLAV